MHFAANQFLMSLLYTRAEKNQFAEIYSMSTEIVVFATFFLQTSFNRSWSSGDDDRTRTDWGSSQCGQDLGCQQLWVHPVKA